MFLESKAVWTWPRGQEWAKDCWGDTSCINFCPLPCHHIQRPLGFSALLKIILADSIPKHGLALQYFVVIALLPTQLMFLLEEHHYYLLEPLCPIVQMSFVGNHSQTLTEYPIQYFQICITSLYLYPADRLQYSNTLICDKGGSEHISWPWAIPQEWAGRVCSTPPTWRH